MAPYSSTFAWKIPWTEEPGGLQPMGSLESATSLSLFTFMHWRRKWQPTPVFLPGNPRDGGALCAAIYGVARSRTRLKRLSSNSSRRNQQCISQFSSVQSLSSVRRCDPMNCSTPGLPVHHKLLEFTQTHVHRVGDAIQPSHPWLSPSPPAPNPSQHQGLFQ